MKGVSNFKKSILKMSENVISKETTYTDNYLLEEPSLYSTKADQNTILLNLYLITLILKWFNLKLVILWI